MIVTKREVRQASKKLLSVLLAVIMIMTSMSVCFGSVAFAAGKDVDVTALANALKYDSIKNATFSGAANNYKVTDPDGKVLAAVEAYFAVVDAMANKNPTNQTPSSGTSNIAQKGESSDKTYRTYNHLNARVKALLKTKMGNDYTAYNVEQFINGLLAGSTVSEGTSQKTVGPTSPNNNTAVPATTLAAAPDVKLTVETKAAITAYTLEQIRNMDDYVGYKVFTVKHANTNYDYKYTYTAATSTCGSSNNDQKYQHDYYFYYNYSSYSVTNGDSVSTATIKAADSAFTADSYYNTADVNAVLALSQDETVLSAAKTALEAEKKKVTDAHNEYVFNYFFGTQYKKAIKNIEDAIVFLGYKDTVDEIKAYYATDISRMSKTEVKAHYDAFAATYSTFTALEKGTQDLIASTYDLDVDAVEARIQEIFDRYEALCILDFKAAADADVAVYETWDIDDVDNGDVNSGDITAAIAALNVHISNLEYYRADLLAEVIGADYVSSLKALKADLEELGVAAGYNEDFLSRYAKFAADIKNITTTDYDKLYNSLKSYDSWYANLKALIDEMKDELGEEVAEKLFDDLNTLMVSHMDAAYAKLNTRTEVQINIAYDLYEAHKAAYGPTVHYVSLDSYYILKDSIGLIDTAAYNFLNSSGNFTVPAETVKKYNDLQNIIVKYNEFVATKGFGSYGTLEIGDITREESEDEIAREGDYTVTDEKVESVINTLEALLANEEVKKVLGSVINKETGAPFSIAGLLTNLLNESVYTDSLINTIIQFVYPLVAKEFAKVWAGLPATITIPDVDTGFLGMKADVQAGLSLYTVEDAIAAVGVFLAPSTLAKNLENAYGKNNGEYAKYTDVITVLKSATTKAVYNLNGEGDEDDTFVNPWEDANLFENVYDEETGEQVFNDDGTPKRVYKLNWGVDEAENKKEAFVNAACAALSGLEPLLFGLLTNRTQANANDGDGAPRGHKIGTGSGSANVGISLSLSIDPITLVLKFGGNDGWDNALAPIFEALGLTNIPHGEDLTTTRKILENGLLAMIDQLIAKLDANPLEFILDALPNLCYALEAGLVEPLLGMLRTEISYYADAKYAVIGGLVSGTMKDAMKSEEPIIVDLGDMINLADMGLDISSFSAIWNMLAESVELLAGTEAPNAAYIALLGELVQIDTNRSVKSYNWGANGKAAHIVANRADVLIYLVKWALESGLLGGIVENPDEVISEIFTNLALNSEDAIAAVVELLNQVEYDTLREYEWFNGIINNESVVGNSAYEIYMNPGNDWTKDKAEYLYNNLDSLVPAIISLAGLDFDLGATIDSLFTNETVTALAALLGSLGDINALIAGGQKDETAGEETPDAPETVAEGEDETETEAPAIDFAALLKGLLGLDFSVYAQYAQIAEGEVIDFGVTDADTFVEALSSLLAPLKPVLDFILAGEDLTINLSETEKVTLVGYDGYNNAIIPLLEALGCEVDALGENEDALTVILEALGAKLKAIKDEPIKGIIDILPGVLYFIASKGLSVSVRNLLQPVYVILDTIRPIYDLDLNELINGLLPEDWTMSINIDDIGVETLFALVGEFAPELDLSGLKDVIYDVCDELATEYDSVSTLQDNWMTAKYRTTGENIFDQADLLTVVLSFLLEWATVEDNAAALDEMLGTEGLIENIGKVFEDVAISYGTPEWYYWFNDDADAFEAYLATGEGLPNTLDSLTYPNDWSEDKAIYLADNLSVLVDAAIGMINKDKEDAPKNVKDLLGGFIDGYINADTVNMLLDMLKEVLANVDDTLLSAGYILDVDLVGLKNYTCEKEIETVSDFAAELAYILDTYAKGLVNLLFFGDDFRIAKKSDNTDTIVINGGEGYEKGLALILEALGCDVPYTADATVANILDSFAKRAEAILADPVNEIIDLLPNLIYFLNAKGLGVAVDNLLQPVYALVDKINALGVLEAPISIEDLIKFEKEDGTEVKLNLEALSLEYIINLVEELTDLDLSEAERILVDLCIGKIEKAKFTYKMTALRSDTVTVILTTALHLVSDEDFAAKLDEMLGTDIIAALKTVFESVDITYSVPEWKYAHADNGTVDTMKYAIVYPNNWNENVAKYVTDALPEIGDMVAGMIDSNYTSLSALLKDKVNVFTTENLDALVGFIADFLGDIDDELLKAAGVLLNADVVGIKSYKAPEGIVTVEEFALELANVLNTYAKGIVEWLLLGKDYAFFVQEDRNIETLPADLIVINGAHGYAEGLALLLEALGCQNLPQVFDAEGKVVEGLNTEAVVTGVLKSLAARINEIFEMPVERAVDLLPNLLYFLNTNGVAAAIDNLTAALTALITKLEVFGVELDINELVNIPELMGIADKYAEGDDVISLDNLTIKSLLKAVSLMTGLDLTLVENVLVGFALGKFEEYDSVSYMASNGNGKALRMVYADEFDKHDMVTVLVTLVVITLTDEGNAEFVKELVGENIYELIMNLCQADTVTVQEFSWMLTDKVGETFTAVETSDLFEEYMYGPHFTEEMAQYVADNFGEFVDNILYLLGLEIAGVSADNLSDLIKGLLNGTLYNSKNVIAIRDALAGVVDNILNLEVNGAVVGGHIAAVLKEAGIADLEAIATVKVPEFSGDDDNARVMFVDALCNVLNPLNGLLKWLLAGENIAFFVSDVDTDALTLKGAHGYSDGIIPLLEVLECENILPAVCKEEKNEDGEVISREYSGAYYDAINNGDEDTIVTSILNPLLDRVEEIVADPANEILAILPNLIYFINSNGIDTVVKNTANAVFMLLAKIEPVAKIDLYETIGIDLAKINMNWIFDTLVEAIYNATGYKLESLNADAIAELTVGTLKEYTSKNGRTAYKMEYTPEGSLSGGPAELVTVVLRLLVKFIMHENNQEMLVGLLKDKLGMNADAEKYLRGVLKVIAECAVDTKVGMDMALSVIYYLFYGVDEAVGGVAGGVKDINKLWKEAIAELRANNPLLADMLEEVLGWEEFDDVIDIEDGVAPNGFIAFFLKIKAWFEKIAEWFRNLFKKDEAVATVALD